MAVDTAAKRYSMMNLASHHKILIIPDGTIAAADRSHLLGLYSGIALDGAAVGIVGFRRSGRKPRQRRRAI